MFAQRRNWTARSLLTLKARQHYELTEEKYRVGKAGVADYNDARNSWLRAESEHIQARFQCLYQTKLLDFYRGRELEF